MLLQYEDHPDTISICSAALPAKLYTRDLPGLALLGKNQAWYT